MSIFPKELESIWDQGFLLRIAESLLVFQFQLALGLEDLRGLHIDAE